MFRCLCIYSFVAPWPQKWLHARTLPVWRSARKRAHASKGRGQPRDAKAARSKAINAVTDTRIGSVQIRARCPLQSVSFTGGARTQTEVTSYRPADAQRDNMFIRMALECFTLGFPWRTHTLQQDSARTPKPLAAEAITCSDWRQATRKGYPSDLLKNG